MEISKEEFLRRLAIAGTKSAALENLLENAMRDHFESSKEGVIGDGENDGAEGWVEDHYDTVSAITDAAALLAEALNENIDDLWNIYNSECRVSSPTAMPLNDRSYHRAFVPKVDRERVQSA